MRCIIIVIVIIVLLLVYFAKFRTLYSSRYILTGNLDVKVRNLMIVAHPDDELIFGGSQLLASDGWLVVCVTNGSNEAGNIYSFNKATSRIHEFIRVMNSLDCMYEIWDYEDYGLNANWDESITNNIKGLLMSRRFEKIVTHSLYGEYGHPQHTKISRIVHSLRPDNLYVFGYVPGPNNYLPLNPYAPEIFELCGIYKSQAKIIKKYEANIIYQYFVKADFL